MVFLFKNILRNYFLKINFHFIYNNLCLKKRQYEKGREANKRQSFLSKGAYSPISKTYAAILLMIFLVRHTVLTHPTDRLQNMFSKYKFDTEALAQGLDEKPSVKPKIIISKCFALGGFENISQSFSKFSGQINLGTL